MPDITYYVTPFVLCSLVVAASVELLKQGTWLWYITKKVKRPANMRRVWRIASVVLGCMTGLAAGGVASTLYWYDGMAVGGGAGLRSTSVVAVLQKLLEKKAASEDA